MSNKMGTIAIKELIDVLVIVFKKAIERFSDGLQPTDFIVLIKWCLTDKELHEEFSEAMKTINFLGQEIVDLKINEIFELIKYTKEKVQELNIDYSNFNEVIKHVPAINNIVKKVFYK